MNDTVHMRKCPGVLTWQVTGRAWDPMQNCTSSCNLMLGIGISGYN